MNGFMQGWKRIQLICLVVCSAVLAGCATTGSTMLSGVQPDPRLTKGEDAQFFSQAGVENCLMGAVAGALTGALVGGKKNATGGALIGAAAGCGAALAGTYYVDKLSKDYANTSERLSVMTNDLKQDTAKVQQRSDTLMAVMADDKKKLDKIRSDIAAKTVDQAAAKKELARIDANINVIQKDTAAMDDLVKQYQLAAAKDPKLNTKAMQAEIKALEGKKAKLQAEADDLYASRSSIALG